MGNIIGIKLADGSFYPVMEEGQPFSKKLELTTVRDDQTTVHLDLYRSATGSMEDAEYVDTLVVENLVPHPKQEHSLNLNINLDENNMLSAEIDDPETGTTTNSKVSLITLEKEALDRDPDYTITSEKDTLDDLEALNFDNDMDELSDLPEEIDLSIDEIQNYEDPLVNISEDFVVDADDGAVSDDSDFGSVAALAAGTALAGGAVLAANLNEDEDLETIEEDIDLDIDPTIQNNLEEIDLDISYEDFSKSTLEDDFTLPEIEDTVLESEPTLEDDFTLPETEEPVLESESILEDDFTLPATEDTVLESESTLEDDFTLPETEEPVLESEPTLEDDFSFEIPESEEMEAFSEGEATLTDDELANLSDFSFEETSIVEEDKSQEDSFDSKDALLTAGLVAGGIAGGTLLANSLKDEEPTLTSETSFEEDFSMSEESLDSSELPSFDDFDISSTDSFFDTTMDLEDDAPFSFDSLPDFDEIPELQENSSESLDSGDFELPDFDSDLSYSNDNFVTSSSGEDALFDSLYEESYKETEKSKKRTTIPVVVCVICALICVGAVAAILWLTKPNLFGKKEAAAVETPVETPIEKEVVSVEVEKEPEPILEEQIAAKEDEIVITPEPVVPVIPEPKEEIKPAEVIYRIKWGDTLWDLAESYYQNPWLYHKIAKANNIKNPDVIISGTDIVIPPLN